jgi:ferric-dicitrate binding protein FerR (iron transport regulator)
MSGGLENIDDLISKYLAGEAGSEEAARLEAWRKSSPDNEDYFLAGKKLFEAMEGAGEQFDVDVDAAWNKLDARLGEAKVVSLRRNLSPARIAAAILLLAALGFVIRWAFVSGGSQPVNYLATNKPHEQKLPDGSKVFMNKNAEITYEIKDGKREVKLKGEAFFEVVHNEAEPFVISVDEVLIKDIGTAFNVKAIPGSDIVEVAVESGEVQFYSESSQGLLLVKGEKATYNKTTKEFIKQTIQPTDNTMSYRSRIFHFSNASLNEVVDAINLVYDSNIKLGNERLGECRLSVDFNNENIDVLVSIIAETLDLEVENRTDSILLKGEACPE